MNQTPTVETLRCQWAKNDAARDAGIPEPPSIRQICNIPYAAAPEGDANWNLADFYYPEQKKDKYPVIVSVHGGGWFYGDKELYKLYTSNLALHGFAVVNFNYRLAPEHQYPAAFEDVCKLIQFLIENAENYQLDMQRFYMVGDSCGAQLVSQYCIFAASEAYQQLFHELAAVKKLIPAKIALNCGIYEMLPETDEMICGWYLPEMMPESLQKSTENILSYMNSKFPPCYLMTSVNDDLMPRTAVMKKRLSELNLPFVYREFGRTNPDDGHVFHLNLRSEDGKKCNREELEFFGDFH